MNALIFGDSQAQGAGSVLENILEERGDKVTRKAYAGFPVYKLLEKAPAGTFDVVYIFAGGNDSPGDHSSAIKLAQHWPGAKVVWFAPPPATYIDNIALAQKVFGPNIKTTDHWYTSGMVKNRDKVADELGKTLMNLPNVRYLDVRAFYTEYPIQPDGIHMSAKTAKECLPGMLTAAENPHLDTRYNPPAPPDKRTWWLLAGAAAATGLYLYAAREKRNPALTTQQKVMLGAGAVGALALLLWPSKAAAAEQGGRSCLKKANC